MIKLVQKNLVAVYIAFTQMRKKMRITFDLGAHTH